MLANGSLWVQPVSGLGVIGFPGASMSALQPSFSVAERQQQGLRQERRMLEHLAERWDVRAEQGHARMDRFDGGKAQALEQRREQHHVDRRIELADAAVGNGTLPMG